MYSSKRKTPFCDHMITEKIYFKSAKNQLRIYFLQRYGGNHVSIYHLYLMTFFSSKNIKFFNFPA